MVPVVQSVHYMIHSGMVHISLWQPRTGLGNHIPVDEQSTVLY